MRARFPHTAASGACMSMKGTLEVVARFGPKSLRIKEV